MVYSVISKITEYASVYHGQNLSDHNAIRLVLAIDVNCVVLSDLDAVRAHCCDWAKPLGTRIKTTAEFTAVGIPKSGVCPTLIE